MMRSVFAYLTKLAGGYEMDHQPLEDAPSMDRLTEMFPDDVYEHPDWYGFGEWVPEAAKAIRAARDKPEAQITIYRSVPHGVTTEINTGAWVTTVRSYAVHHGLRMERNGEPTWDILAATVSAKHIHNGGNDIIEWGYFGPTIQARVS